MGGGPECIRQDDIREKRLLADQHALCYGCLQLGAQRMRYRWEEQGSFGVVGQRAGGRCQDGYYQVTFLQAQRERPYLFTHAISFRWC